jgi:hypothetical protein
VQRVKGQRVRRLILTNIDAAVCPYSKQHAVFGTCPSKAVIQQQTSVFSCPTCLFLSYYYGDVTPNLNFSSTSGREFCPPFDTATTKMDYLNLLSSLTLTLRSGIAEASLHQ